MTYGLYKFEKNEQKRVFVLDCGGRILDFTLLMLTKNDNGIICDVEDTFGDPFFGGKVFDIALMEAIKKENKIFNNIDNNKYLRLKVALEKTKIELSKYDSTNIILENFCHVMKIIYIIFKLIQISY